MKILDYYLRIDDVDERDDADERINDNAVDDAAVNDDAEIRINIPARPLFILSERKHHKAYEKLKRELHLKKGHHFGCSTCAAVNVITPLCGMEPDGSCTCHRIRVVLGDLLDFIDDNDRVWIPDDIHCTVRERSTEWSTIGGVCFRLEVHKCTTCQNIMARRYVNTDLEKHLMMNWAGKFEQVVLVGAPEPYYIAESANFKILKEADVE